MRQALPKSQFYARTTANIALASRSPAPSSRHAPVRRARPRADAVKPLDLAKDAHVAALGSDWTHYMARPHSGQLAPLRQDGLDEATLALFAKLAQLLDADPIGKIEALRTNSARPRQKKAARAQGAQVLKRAEQMEARLNNGKHAISQTVTDAIQARIDQNRCFKLKSGARCGESDGK